MWPLLLALLPALLPAERARPQSGYRGWPVYGGDAASIRYSALDQIHRANVSRLRVAWTFDTGDAFPEGEMQCNPILAGGLLYVTSPKLRVFALDPATGRPKWTFDPEGGSAGSRRVRNRGITHWGTGTESRIFVTSRHYLYAVNAADGKPVAGFGDNGRVDLRTAFDRDKDSITISVSTPGIIYRDLLILGSLVSEDLPSAPGDIRAYDVRTGALRWTFHTIPRPGEYGYATWPKDAWKYTGGANNWAGMSLDDKRGIVYVPTGSAAFDFYGANRLGDNLFANTLLALDAATGRRLWHFQTVRHDVWDRDLPAPPSLVTVLRRGRLIDAVAQATKTGFLFVFDRVSGKPLFPIEQRPVPPSDVEGEVVSKTQPVPLKPPPFARQIFTLDNVTNRTPEAREFVLRQVRPMKMGQLFLPPSLQGSVIFPGLDGGAEWGGTAFDPETGLLYVNASERLQALKLVERPNRLQTSRDLYLARCATCHGSDLAGDNLPSLAGLGKRMSLDRFLELLRQGSGRMPAFRTLPPAQLEALAGYLLSGRNDPVQPASAAPPIRYRREGRNVIWDHEGYPGATPPWGTLSAIDLDRGVIAWQVRLGEHPELAAKGLRNTGSENYGGPVVTAGGLVFIGATKYDRKFHAFDKTNGRLLWETELPAAGLATPAVYESNGRQFVVIAAGGGKDELPVSGKYVAFALP